MELTESTLRRAVRGVDAGRWLMPLRDACARYEIETANRLAAFLAQCGHESASFTQVVENLNYSARGLADRWPQRYSTGHRSRAGATGSAHWIPNQLAVSLGRRPEAIANNVYANRLGNGSEASGDGWRFRGRALLQITGRANYRAASIALGLDFVATPELLEEPRFAALVSAWWWHEHNANVHADRADWLAVSRLVNLGSAASGAIPSGWNDRHARTITALKGLHTGEEPVA
jgi:putative chitinase